VGVISNFYVHSSFRNKNKKLITFSVSFFKNKTFFSKIKLLSTNTKNFYINIRTLPLLKKIFKNSIIIISTSKGVISLQDSINLGVGGKLLYIIS
jgi:ribosomal protein S8